MHVRYEWHNDMSPAFTSTIMAPNFKIEEITSGTRRTIPIPYEMSQGPRGRSKKYCPTYQGEKIRSGSITTTFSGANWLHNPCFLGGPQ